MLDWPLIAFDLLILGLVLVMLRATFEPWVRNAPTRLGLAPYSERSLRMVRWFLALMGATLALVISFAIIDRVALGLSRQARLVIAALSSVAFVLVGWRVLIRVQVPGRGHRVLFFAWSALTLMLSVSLALGVDDPGQ